MAFKIALNAGHGLKTLGKRCSKALDPKETREWTLNSRICDKIEAKLKAYTGYSLLRLDDPTGSVDVSLSTRTSKANKFGADFYLSVHHNAGVNGGKGGGAMAIVYTKASAASCAWQKELYDSIIKHTGLKGNRSNPMPKQNLHECRESTMPCVLLECGFMDSSTDVPIILTDSFADKVATACVEILVKRGNLTKISNTVEPNKKVELVPKGDTKTDTFLVKLDMSGTFTVTEVRQGEGSKSGWGKLKSGSAWVNLDYVTKV